MCKNIQYILYHVNWSLHIILRENRYMFGLNIGDIDFFEIFQK